MSVARKHDLPPAAVDSFALRAVEQIRRAGMLALVFASVVMLTACTVSSPQAANENQVPANTQETATPYSPQSAEPKANPTEEPKEIAEQPKSSDSPSEEPKIKVEKSADYGGVAYEAQGDGPQLVQRSGKTVKAADRLTATAESEHMQPTKTESLFRLPLRGKHGEKRRTRLLYWSVL